MKLSIFIFISMFFLNFTGEFKDDVDEVADLGKKSREIMVDCDWQERCVYKRIKTLIVDACEDFRKYEFGFKDAQECKLVFANLFLI